MANASQDYSDAKNVSNAANSKESSANEFNELQSDNNNKAKDVVDAVPMQLSQYNFSHSRRGVCVIINNRVFNKLLTGQDERIGTDVDADNLQSCFKMLGFDVRRLNDVTTTDMSIEMRKVSEEDHTDADCFVCVILSHGEEGKVYGTNGTVPLERLFNMFKGDICPTLAGKPKIFFIQACRGRKYDLGTDCFVDQVDAKLETEENVRRIPVEADVLMAYSVVPGYFSWRNGERGSWFVQALARVLNQCSEKMDLLHMLTLVNEIVANDFESDTDSEYTSHMKQMPCIVSMLTKQVFFKSRAK